MANPTARAYIAPEYKSESILKRPPQLVWGQPCLLHDRAQRAAFQIATMIRHGHQDAGPGKMAKVMMAAAHML